MTDEEKKPEKEEVEQPKEVEEPKEDAKEEEKEINDLVSKITKSITDELKASREEIQEAKESKAKKEVLNQPTATYIDKDEKVFKKRDGEFITLKTSEIKMGAEWFRAFLDKDRATCKEIMQKLEPLNEGTAARGGNLVPTLLANFITEVKEDASVIRPRANVINMSGMKTDTLDISGIANKPRVAWNDELAAKSTSSVVFNKITLTPYKMAAIITMSMELRDDSPFNIVQMIGRLLGEAVAREEDRVFINGNGTGQPTGIDNYALTAVNAGGALTFDHIISAYYRLPQGYRSQAYWIANSRTIAVIRHLKTTTNDYVLRDHGFITEPTIPAMLGRPVLENNNCKSDSIFFGDLSNYHIADKMSPTLDTSEEATIGTGSNAYNLWQRNMIGIKIEERVDAELAPTQSFVEITNTGVS